MNRGKVSKVEMVWGEFLDDNKTKRNTEKRIRTVRNKKN